MSNDTEKSSGTLYVWKSKRNGKWYRTGISTNGAVSVPSQGYTRKATAEDLTPVRNFVRNPTIVYGEPPKKKR